MIVFTSCSATGRKTKNIRALPGSENVLIIQQENLGDCSDAQKITAMSLGDTIEESYSIALQDATNKAVLNRSNTLLFKDYYIHSLAYSSRLRINFEAYNCTTLKISNSTNQVKMTHIKNEKQNKKDLEAIDNIMNASKEDIKLKILKFVEEESKRPKNDAWIGNPYPYYLYN